MNKKSFLVVVICMLSVFLLSTIISHADTNNPKEKNIANIADVNVEKFVLSSHNFLTNTDPNADANYGATIIQLKFTFPEKYKIQKTTLSENEAYYYELPENIDYITNESNILNNKKAPVGSCKIEGNKLLLSFEYDNFIEQKSRTCFITIDGTITLDSIKHSGYTEFDFPGVKKFSCVFGRDLNIKNTIKELNNDTVIYDLYITSIGPNKNITVTDTFTNAINVNSDAKLLTDKTRNVKLNIKDNTFTVNIGDLKDKTCHLIYTASIKKHNKPIKNRIVVKSGQKIATDTHNFVLYMQENPVNKVNK